MLELRTTEASTEQFIAHKHLEVGTVMYSSTPLPKWTVTCSKSVKRTRANLLTKNANLLTQSMLSHKKK